MASPSPSNQCASEQTRLKEIRDALIYLNTIKQTFQEKPEKYQRFIRILKDFSAGRIDASGVSAKAKHLFTGHPDLILGFNEFLPDGHKVALPSEDEEATRSVKKISLKSHL